MSIHALREALHLVPEALELCKSASTDDGFSTASREATLASALKMTYMVKVAGEKVSSDDMVRVSTAVNLYKLASQVEDLAGKMTSRNLEKRAYHADKVAQLRVAESYVETLTCGIVNLEKVASISTSLYDSYPEDVVSPSVKRYACAEVLVKEAAVAAVSGRARVCPNRGFEKLATILGASDFNKFSQEEVRNIAACVTALDKKAQLTGFDFYKEAFITKEAAASSLLVTIDKQQVPVENILRAPIGHILGDDVAKEMGSDPFQIKAVVEALPMDMQKLLLSRVK